MTIERRVTTSRIGRLGMLGRMATGIAGTVVAEGARRYSQGKTPTMADLLLTPNNAKRLGRHLSEMRGAAMKIGQLLSMDSGQILPREFSEALVRLRDDAHRMPLGQVAEILDEAWGKGWTNEFRKFSFTPLAAASIGQVHRATLKNGQELAIKIQYPGIKRSIDSDVDNVARLLNLFKVLPEQLAMDELLADAKAQLHMEADYRLESNAIKAFARHLPQDGIFEVPRVIDSLTRENVLAMSFQDGVPIDRLVDAPMEKRNAASAALLELALREVFDWGLVQTDPNYSNFLYQPDSERIQLLDFGATRHYAIERRAALKQLLIACATEDTSSIQTGAVEVGYLDARDPVDYKTSVIELLLTATTPLRENGSFDFGHSKLAEQMREIVVDLRMNHGAGRMPPPDVLFLHRKLGGLYLLLTKLRAILPVRKLMTAFMDPVNETHEISPGNASKTHSGR